MLGPDSDGRFRKIKIEDIHCKKVPVKNVKAGQMCSFRIKLGESAEKWMNNSGGQIRTGMVLLHPNAKPKATYVFEAEIWTFDGSTRVIKNIYQPLVHTGHVR